MEHRSTGKSSGLQSHIFNSLVWIPAVSNLCCGALFAFTNYHNYVSLELHFNNYLAIIFLSRRNTFWSFLFLLDLPSACFFVFFYSLFILLCLGINKSGERNLIVGTHFWAVNQALGQLKKALWKKTRQWTFSTVEWWQIQHSVPSEECHPFLIHVQQSCQWSSSLTTISSKLHLRPNQRSNICLKGTSTH